MANEQYSNRSTSNQKHHSEYRHELTPEEYFEGHARKWIENDQASIVGGCCGIFPEHMLHISSNISNL